MQANSMIRDQLRAMIIQEIAPRFAGTSIADQRATYDAIGSQVELPSDSIVARSQIANVPVEVLSTRTKERRVVLHVHGGGFSIGSCESHRGMAAQLGEACRARVVLPEYRLAPEHPFPAGLDDLFAVYRAILRSGTPAEQIIVTGDSAGCSLAVALVLRALAARVAVPRAIVLLSPWLDLTCSGESMQSRAGLDPLVTGELLASYVSHYVGTHGDPTHPLVSPLFADLEGLPPMLIQAGDHEILRSDSTRMFERASAAGGHVELEIFPDVWHIFHLWAPMLPEAMQAFARMREFVDARFASQPLRVAS